MRSTSRDPAGDRLVHDTTPVSNLARPGVFRLNISLGRQRFAQLVGGQRDTDFVVLDVLMPRPVYAPQHWACILVRGHGAIFVGDDLAAANVNRS